MKTSPISAHTRCVPEPDGVQAIHNHTVEVVEVTKGARHERGRQGVLHGRGVLDSYDASRARRLKDRKEGAAEAALAIELDDLLVVVGAL